MNGLLPAIAREASSRKLAPLLLPAFGAECTQNAPLQISHIVLFGLLCGIWPRSSQVPSYLAVGSKQ